MFLQETKTKRGGKTYISYLVRESYRTANGPRGRTVCNLTHLPKEVREIVARALRGQALVPLDRLEVNNIHSFGGCVVLEDAARRHGMAEWLAPMDARDGALVRAMIFGGLLTAPSVAPFHVEAQAARLAMFCGLDPEKERFEAADLTVALKTLDERWPEVRAALLRPPHAEARAVTFFKLWQTGKRAEMGALGMDTEGIPIPLGEEVRGLEGFLERRGANPKARPFLMLDEETAAPVDAERLEQQMYVIELGTEALGALLRQLNPGQLVDALRTGGPVEARHHGKRHVLAPAEGPDEAERQEAEMRMGSLNELASITGGRNGDAGGAHRAGLAAALKPGTFHGVMTNVCAERLPAAAAMQWALRARVARAAFAPAHIVTGDPAAGDGAPRWRNHERLQFLTHRLRCHLHAEWLARGESRPVEEVLRDLQEVHRATLTVDGIVVRRMATLPSKRVGELLGRLRLLELFGTPEM